MPLREMSPEVRYRMESLLLGDAAEASAHEFAFRDLCFMAACAEYGQSALTVRESRLLEVNQRGVLRMISPNHVVFSPG